MGRNALIKAIVEKDVKKVEQLLEAWHEGRNTKVNPALTDKDGWSALHYAAYVGDKQIIISLLAFLSNEQKAIDAAASDHIIHSIFTASPEVQTQIALPTTGAKDIFTRGGKGMTEGMTLLHLAASIGHAEIMEILIQVGADVSVVDQDGDSIFAYVGGSVKCVEVLLKSKARNNSKIEVDKPNEKGVTPLLWAAKAKEGSVDIVKVLLDYGANIDHVDNYGYTALDNAVLKGFAEGVYFLLDQGAKINNRNVDPFGWDCFLRADKEGHREKLKCLLDFIQENHYSHTALYFAVIHGLTGLVELLIQYGADVNGIINEIHACAHVTALENFPPIYVAAREGYLDIVKCLYHHGADVRTKGGDLFCNTPLQRARKKGHKEIVQFLKYLPPSREPWIKERLPLSLMQHKDKERKEKEQEKTPEVLLYFASQEGNEKGVELLLSKGAKVDQAIIDGITSLHSASLKGHEKVVELLLSKGAKVDQANNDGATPLWFASYQGHEKVVELLLSKGAKVDLADNDGRTPLYIASQEGHEKVVELLLSKGAKGDQANNDGTTPLYFASQEGHEKVVELLLSKGANVDQENNNGRPPLHIAVQMGHIQVVKCLYHHGAKLNTQCHEGYTPIDLATTDEIEEFLRNPPARKPWIEVPEEKEEVVEDSANLLIQAAQHGDIATVQRLINKGVDINMIDKFGETALHKAATDGYNHIVELLVKAGAEVDRAKKNGITPLWKAASKGQVEVIKVLLRFGAAVNVADSQGVTSLWIAAYNGHTSSVKELVKQDADMSLASDKGSTPFQIAKQRKHQEVVDYLEVEYLKAETVEELRKQFVGQSNVDEIAELIASGKDINQKNHNGESLLYLAAKEGDLESVKCLYHHGSEVENGKWSKVAGKWVIETPLEIAHKNRHAGVVSFLKFLPGKQPWIKLKKMLNQEDHIVANDSDKLQEQLMTAIRNDDEFEVGRLISARAKTNKADEDGGALLYAAAYYDHKEVVEQLLRSGIKVDQAWEGGYTPLLVASHEGQKKVVELLLSKGANVDLAVNNGTTPLYFASQEGHEKVVELLLSKGAKVDQANNDGTTPLWFASYQGHEKVVELLLSKGANVDLAIEDGRTPMHNAAQQGYIQVVKCLYHHGAKLNTQSQKGNTPIDLATTDEIKEFLRNPPARKPWVLTDEEKARRIEAERVHKEQEEKARVEKVRKEREERIKREQKERAEKARKEQVAKELVKKQMTVNPVLELSYEDIQFGKEISEGSFGKIYVGSYKKQAIVIKAVSGEMSERDRQEFIREVKIMGRLRSKYIVQFIGVSLHEKDKTCYVMEYMQNDSLYQALTQEEFTAKQRHQIALEIAQGLQYLHEEDIVHADVKSANVLLNEDWHAKLADFGLSKITDSMITEIQEQSKAVRWLAPEVIQGNGKPSKQADIYGYGMVLWELFTGHHPFEEYSDEEVIQKVIRGEREVIPDNMPKVYAKIIESCWSSDPQARLGLDKIINAIEGYEPIDEKAFKEAKETKYQEQGLIESAKQGEVKAVTYLLTEAGIEINGVDEEEKTALHHAILGKHTEIIELLLENPALDIDQASMEGITALHYAAQIGELELVKRLVEKGANVLIEDGLDQTPRSLAIERKHSKVAGYLKRIENQISKKELEEKEREECKKQEKLAQQINFKEQGIVECAKRGDLEAVTYLLTLNDTDINVDDEEEKTALQHAILGKHRAIIELLLSRPEIDVEHVSDEEQTALHYAALQGDLVIVKALIEKGANVLIEDGLDQTPRSLAIEKRHAKVAGYLKRQESFSQQRNTNQQSKGSSGSTSRASKTSSPLSSGSSVRSQEEIKRPSSKQSNRRESQPISDEAGSMNISFAIPYEDLTFGRILGEGGFGIVYQGTWQYTDVAIKRLHMNRLTNAALDEFKNETKVMANLRHSHVVQLFGACFEPGKCSLVMEYMPKGSLYGVLQNSQSLSWKIRYQIAMDITSGLSVLHAKNILHEDLKSLNILLDDHMRAKIADFGLSKVRKESISESRNSDKSIGTYEWMDPTLMMGESFTKKSDMYSYGVILWELAAMKRPYASAYIPNLVPMSVMNGKTEPIPEECDSKYPTYAALIRRCWSMRQTDRPTIEEAAKALEDNPITDEKEKHSEPSKMDAEDLVYSSDEDIAPQYQDNLKSVFPSR